ncbi:MAG: protein adenylyltransferase SelO [Ilumatobacteraceae bacterium]
MLDDSFARALEGLYEPWQAAPFPEPRTLVLDRDVATLIGFDPDAPPDPAVLVGNTLLPGSRPIAMAYSGHQFGGWSPRLGDGRALLLGEVVGPDGVRRDVHLKGSGRTPFARGGDGKAAVGPMLREHLVSTAMHALGIPTTRSLAVVATGEPIRREQLLPGAVLVRVAASHLRVGTFQFAAATGRPQLLADLTGYAIRRHHPAAANADNPPLELFRRVLEAQASLVADWMTVGFIHGVMNTDNMTISGETIDYGPCAFMDRYHPGTVFSSIDHGGRYAYGEQPRIAQWNLARLAEAMLPLFATTEDEAVALATEVLHTFPERYEAHRSVRLQAKLGLPAPPDRALTDDLYALLEAQGVDGTTCFRSLSALVRGSGDETRSLFHDTAAFDAWAAKWSAARERDERPADVVADSMDRVNPRCIPRNHLVEEALDAATAGDLAPFEQLLDAISRPFDDRPGLDRYAQPAPPDAPPHRTFCGT